MGYGNVHVHEHGKGRAMKILIVGGGGREHALGWGIVENSSEELELYFAPGNPGTATLGTNVAIDVSEIKDLAAYAAEEKIDFTVVGPELPLSLGIVDEFEARGLSVFGPNKRAAELEASKNFAKEVMISAGVPTAKYSFFDSEEKALKELPSFGPHFVVKADGLAAGKGVIVTKDQSEAEEAIQSIFSSGTSNGVVLEEFLEGKEASYIVLTDGERVVPFATAHDYKRIGEGDTGLNTGGMGTVSPTSHLTPDLEEKLLDTVIYPTLKELKKRGITYKGFLYAGLMISPTGDVKVLEYNARMGDPEAQVLMRRWRGNLLKTLQALTSGSEIPEQLPPDEEAAVCVVMASDGYPSSSRKGDVILGVEKANALGGCVVFHAGTGEKDSQIITNGGRVLGVTSTGETVDEARLKAYQAINFISFDGAQYRKDIATCD